MRIIVPLANLDNLYLTWLLQPAVGTPPAYSDFMNSADFTITVPNGTKLVNNPGGSLFQVSGQTSVPEPNADLLLGSGLVLALLFGKRQREHENAACETSRHAGLREKEIP